MNYDKIKSLEASIIEALKAHDCDPKESIDFAEKCFAAQRVEYLQETRIRNLEGFSKNLEAEIRRHKTCVENLRGYIDYLEKEKDLLEQQINQE